MQAEFTGYRDFNGKKIYSDSLIEYENTAPIMSVSTLHLVSKENGQYGLRRPYLSSKFDSFSSHVIGEDLRVYGVTVAAKHIELTGKMK